MEGINSNQIGEIKVFDCFGIKHGEMNYVLQLIKVSATECTFISYINDGGTLKQGIQKLDVTDLMNVNPEIITLSKLDAIPDYMKDAYINPKEFNN